MPRCRKRPGFCLAVSDYACNDQIRVVECGAVGVRERIAELPAFVNRPGRFRRGVTRNPAGKGELPEQLAQPIGILLDRWIGLAVGPFQVGVRYHPGTAVSGTADVDDVQVTQPDHAVEVGIDEIEPRRGTPVSEQAWLDMPRSQRLPKQWI